MDEEPLPVSERFHLSRAKSFLCCITGQNIPPERVEYLMSENVPECRMTSIEGAKATVKRRKIIVVDDIDTQFFCDAIDNSRIYAVERFGAEGRDWEGEDAVEKGENDSPVEDPDEEDLKEKKEDD